MSRADVKAFYQRLANDENFYSQVQNAKSKVECSQIVKAAGYHFTQQEYEEFTSNLLELANTEDDELQELAPKELEAVVGGASSLIKVITSMQQPYGVIDIP